MAKMKIFISSVQAEFTAERKMLHEYICADPLLGKFFEPFLFELLAAADHRVDEVYLKEVEKSDIYLGLLGRQYGFENADGISPTEREYDHAALHHKTKLIFVAAHKAEERHPKEQLFVKKTQKAVIHKKFGTKDELKADVYASLVRYLEEKEIIRTAPFDAAFHNSASLADIDHDKLRSFIEQAHSKRGFPFSGAESAEKVLTHLNLFQNGRLTNAAILLFGAAPQRFFINSEVRCASFIGTMVEKPISSYKVFKGTVFELAEQAFEFVLNKLDYRIETRSEQIQIPGEYEIPKEVITEAIVNAIAHRDYFSNASVQVMLFKDRVEIWNPGALPMGWTAEKLKQLHTSVPANPLLAEPLYLAGYIERLGTGTLDIVAKCLSHGLKEPEFIQTEDFKVKIYRRTFGEVSIKYATTTVSDQVGVKSDQVRRGNDQVSDQVGVKSDQVRRGNDQVSDQVGVKSDQVRRENGQVGDQVGVKSDQVRRGSDQVGVKNDQVRRGSDQVSDQVGVKSDQVRRGSDQVSDQVGVKSDQVRRGNDQVSDQVGVKSDQVRRGSDQVGVKNDQVKALIASMSREYSRQELMNLLEVKHGATFRNNYLKPALKEALIETTQPDSPNSPTQKYRLTPKGKVWQEAEQIANQTSPLINYVSDYPIEYVSNRVIDRITDQVKALIISMDREHSRQQLMHFLKLKHGATFRNNYLNPALKEALIEMTQPDSPNSPTQKYRLTPKGKAWKEKLK